MCCAAAHARSRPDGTVVGCFRTQPWSVWEGACGKYAAVATVEAAGEAAVVVAAPGRACLSFERRLQPTYNKKSVEVAVV